VSGPFTLGTGASGLPSIRRMDRLAPCVVRLSNGGGIELGGVHISSEDILITPERDASIVVGKNTYRGLLRIHRIADGLVLTNHVDIESYLRGVLRGELPKHFHREAFKAQCVAARTYVLYQMQHTEPERSFDVYDNEGSQMYLGVRGEGRKADAAVAKTRGQVCVYDNGRRETLFCTYYSSTCGGRSQPVRNFKPNDPDVPPLRGNVVCTDCYLARFYRWDPLKLSKAELTRRIVARYPSVERLGTIVGLRPKAITVDGRLIRIQLDGSTGQNETLVGEDFRLSIGGRSLKSTRFDIETGRDHFIFKNGQGYGHGVGLCQNGMDAKACRGMGYREILATYYPTSKIATLYQ